MIESEINAYQGRGKKKVLVVVAQRCVADNTISFCRQATRMRCPSVLEANQPTTHQQTKATKQINQTNHSSQTKQANPPTSSPRPASALPVNPKLTNQPTHQPISQPTNQPHKQPTKQTNKQQLTRPTGQNNQSNKIR